MKTKQVHFLCRNWWCMLQLLLGAFSKVSWLLFCFFLWLQVMHAPTTAGRSYKGQLAYDLGTHGQFQNTLYCVYFSLCARVNFSATALLFISVESVACALMQSVGGRQCSECVWAGGGGGHKSLVAPPPILWWVHLSPVAQWHHSVNHRLFQHQHHQHHICKMCKFKN